MSVKLIRRPVPVSRFSIRKIVTRDSKDTAFPPLARDPRDAKGGFGDEFPLLCARAGASMIPQVMVLHPETGQPVPLLSKIQTVEEDKIKSPGDSEGIAKGALDRGAELAVTTSRKLEQLDESCVTPCPAVMAYFDDNEKQDVLRKLVFKGFPIDNGIIRALGTILHYYDGLNCIQMEDTKLTAPLLAKLSNYLIATKKVCEIVLNGNPIVEQNYYLLLQNTGLKRLSLTRCGIDDNGVRDIAEELTFKDSPDIQTLTHLNLSENRIGDKGLEYISKGLRSNRTLLELNLSRNMISDPGATALAAVGMRFPLNTEELRRRKTRADNRRKARADMVRQKLQQLTLVRESTSSAPSKRDRRVTISDEDREKVEMQVDREIPYDSHPFTWDARPENFDMWCIGNFHLREINLEYNKIGLLGVQKFLDTVEYQRMLKEKENKREKGVANLLLQGNPIPQRYPQLGKIQELLTVQLRALRPPRERKQPSTGKHGSGRQSPMPNLCKNPHHSIDGESGLCPICTLKDASVEASYEKIKGHPKRQIQSVPSGAKVDKKTEKKRPPRLISRRNSSVQHIEHVARKSSMSATRLTRL